ncbi:MAG: peptidoglycan-associated lipoprotein Pal [Kordiimonadaceae bacterium]|nr:peptidoglycan-associated lipoprotein Pal [Kordiimonadaceae bacterium]MBO6569110.1 peptidoglycan-associated lipoprotein Pal [Kordiimonadaceae bacterium]MBO6964585.1 peptidoglycan-associated lipoprotein Pal [Kordiimonadaceae bacterium]
MTSVHLGKKFLTLSAAAVLLAACSKDPVPDRVPADPDAGTEQAGNNGQPDAVTTPQLTAEELEAQAARDRFGASASQSALEAFAGDRVFFAYDSSELTDEARATLASQAEWLDYHSRARVTIEGHCDERGTREYNLALGERRANAVKSYLMALGVSANRINTISYGKERPAVVGNGESSWSQNRRGVMTVR